jgi:hypothetical protein
MKYCLALAAVAALIAGNAFAAPHTYQVTGPVLELSDKSIVISKGKENWEIARDANTKIPADVKVGSKVTIEYTMTAVGVTDKTPAPKADKAAKKAK